MPSPPPEYLIQATSHTGQCSDRAIKPSEVNSDSQRLTLLKEQLILQNDFV